MQFARSWDWETPEERRQRERRKYQLVVGNRIKQVERAQELQAQAEQNRQRQFAIAGEREKFAAFRDQRLRGLGERQKVQEGVRPKVDSIANEERRVFQARSEQMQEERARRDEERRKFR